MSKEIDAIKRNTKMLGYMSIATFVCALYIGLTSFAMHGTLEEIKHAVICLAISGFVLMFGLILYLNIELKKRKEETDT